MTEMFVNFQRGAAPITTESVLGVHQVSDIPITHFMTLALREGLAFTLSDKWDVDAKDLVIDQVLYSGSKGRSSEEVTYRKDGSLIRLRLERGGQFFAWIAADDPGVCETLMWEIKEQYPEAADDEVNTVAVNFWANSANGPASFRRKIAVPTWEEIEGNYADEARRMLSNMTSEEFEPGKGGQLILWEGSPGTGKTYALRAIAQSWKKWAHLHYVSDPEEFFGKASYMYHVLLNDRDEYEMPGMPERDSTEKWNVLILEDCGELLSADAKERTGTAVTRLLNMVDGMIGQGLRVLVLVTTNEPVKKFHPAVTRPGRCAISLSYDPLDVDEANEWLRNAGSAAKVNKPTTLAQLYALAEGREDTPVNSRSTIGF